MRKHQHLATTFSSLLAAICLTAGSVSLATTAGGTTSVPGSTLEDRIRNAPGLSDTDRACMLDNLYSTRTLGLPSASVESVFPGAGNELSPATLLDLQQAVIDAATEGLPVDLILAKVREGRIKGAAEPQLTDATRKMAIYIRSAKQIVDSVDFTAVEDTDAPEARHHMLDVVAQQLWRGLTEQEYLSLCNTGRRSDNICDAADVLAAGEVAVRLLEAGVDSGRALEFARETIRRGYRREEMRQIQLMVVTCHQHGGAPDEFMASMEYCINVDMGPAEMYGYMMRGGWMGPGDLYNPGENPRVRTRGHGGQNEMERGKRQGEGGPDR